MDNKEKEEYSKIINSNKFSQWLNDRDFKEVFFEYLKEVENDFTLDKYNRKVYRYPLRKQVSLWNTFNNYNQEYLTNNITRIIPKYIMLDFWNYINKYCIF